MRRRYTIESMRALAENRLLREKARREGKSLNAVVLDALRRALDLAEEPVVHRDLDYVAGTWTADAEVDRALEDQRRIAPDL